MDNFVSSVQGHGPEGILSSGGLNAAADLLSQRGPHPSGWHLHLQIVEQIWFHFDRLDVDLFCNRGEHVESSVGIYAPRDRWAFHGLISESMLTARSLLHFRQAFCVIWRIHIGQAYFKAASGPLVNGSNGPGLCTCGSGSPLRTVLHSTGGMAAVLGAVSGRFLKECVMLPVGHPRLLLPGCIAWTWLHPLFPRLWG